MKRLGRGLGAILEDAEAGYLKDLPDSGITEIDVLKIKPNPFQPRKEFNQESIDELAKSIKKHGLIQPIIVIKNKNNDEYVLVAGERRLKAFKKLGKEKIKAIIVDYTLDDLREYALIENIQREDLSPIEIALSLYELIKQHGYTHEELAKNIGKSRTYITNMLRILNLPDEVIDKIRTKELSFGHAKILVSLPEDKAKELSKKILKEKLSVRDVEKIVKKVKENKKNNNYIDENVIKIAQLFKENGLKVEIGKEFIKIKYKNDTDIEKLQKLLGINH